MKPSKLCIQIIIKCYCSNTSSSSYYGAQPLFPLPVFEQTLICATGLVSVPIVSNQILERKLCSPITAEEAGFSGNGCRENYAGAEDASAIGRTASQSKRGVCMSAAKQTC